MPFRPHQWKIPPSLKDAGLFLWTDTILVPVILFFSLAITVLVRPSFGPSVFWSFQMGFQGGQFRLSACLMCLLFLRISQTRARRVGENSQMAGLLQPGRITMSQECTCAVFYFSLFLLWRLHWAVSVLFLAFTTSFWVLSSKDSSEAKIPCNIESVFVSQGWCRKLPHMGWLKAAETYSAIILDARTPRPWWWQGPPPLALGVDPPCLFLISGSGPGFLMPRLQGHGPGLCFCHCGTFSLWVSVCCGTSLSLRARVLMHEPPPPPPTASSQLDHLCKDSYFQMRPQSQVRGAVTSAYLGDMVQSVSGVFSVKWQLRKWTLLFKKGNLHWEYC